jgi:NADPH-dependent 2,4-dienoyl-CoA reductase/sulfur reductase-like enzyme
MEIIRYQSEYHRSQVKRLDVPYRLCADADAEMILSERPDIVVLATGAHQVIPNIEGLSAALASGFALTIDQAMSRKRSDSLKESIVIYGAGMGGELAIDYALRGFDVRLLDPHSRFTPVNYLGSRGPRVIHFLQKVGVKIESDITVKRVDGRSLFIADKGDEVRSFSTDRLIIALGRQPNNKLADDLKGKGPLVQVIGDARVPRSYANAIHEAAYLVRRA